MSAHFKASLPVTSDELVHATCVHAQTIFCQGYLGVLILLPVLCMHTDSYQSGICGQLIKSPRLLWLLQLLKHPAKPHATLLVYCLPPRGTWLCGWWSHWPFFSRHRDCQLNWQCSRSSEMFSKWLWRCWFSWPILPHVDYYANRTKALLGQPWAKQPQSIGHTFSLFLA